MLAVFLVAVTQLPPLAMSVLVAVVFAAGAWEWAGLAGWGYALGANGVLSGIRRPMRWIHFDLSPGSNLELDGY